MKTFQQSKDKGFIKLEQVNLITDKQEKKEEANRQQKKKKTDRQHLALHLNIAEGVAGLQGSHRSRSISLKSITPIQVQLIELMSRH